jgi:aspartate aminotransferase
MLADRVKKIKPSPTLAMDAKSKAMKAEGLDIINFALGEPDFDTPAHIKEAAIKAIHDGFTKYTQVGGTDQLKDAIIQKLKKDNKIDYTREEILVSCGAKHTLYNIAQALYGTGDEVLIPSPYWVSYPDQVLLNDATPVFVKTREEDSFTVKPEELEAAITKKTKALILNSPSNPTGFAYDEKTLRKIAEICLKHKVIIISDEIYEKLLYDGFKSVSIASFSKEVKDITITVNGLSKSHAMTGWRIGYAAGPKEIIKPMTSIQSQSTSNPASISQWAAVAALTGPQESVEMMRLEFDKRRKVLVDGLNAIPGIKCLAPKGAFYAFPNVSALYGRKAGDKVIKGSLDFATYMLESANVALVQGEAFGDDNYVRISYATSMENIQKALVRIREAVGKLK